MLGAGFAVAAEGTLPVDDGWPHFPFGAVVVVLDPWGLGEGQQFVPVLPQAVPQRGRFADCDGLRKRYRILDHARLRTLFHCEDGPQLHAHAAERAEAATKGTTVPVCQWARHLAVATKPWIQAAADAMPRPFRTVTDFGGTECDGTVAAIATSGPNRRRYLPQFFGRSDFPGATGSS